jgi:hypothetical protein
MNVKSLYNKQSIQDSINSEKGQYGITLLCTLGKGKDKQQMRINGILKEPLSTSIEASWQTLSLESIIQSIASSNPFLGAIDTAIDFANAAAGSSFINSGIFSRLFYKNSGRMGIAPVMRVFDYNGDGICTRVATVLNSLCIPTNVDTLNLSEPISRIKQLGDDASKAVGFDINKAPRVVQREAQVINQGLDNIASSTANWSDSPNPLSIRIGNWLTIREAVLESVQCSFSYECSDNGPIYADFSMKFETIENLAIGTDGNIKQITLGTSLEKSRVSITGSNQVFQG